MLPVDCCSSPNTPPPPQFYKCLAWLWFKKSSKTGMLGTDNFCFFTCHAHVITEHSNGLQECKNKRTTINKIMTLGTRWKFESDIIIITHAHAHAAVVLWAGEGPWTRDTRAGLIIHVAALIYFYANCALRVAWSPIGVQWIHLRAGSFLCCSGAH